MIKQIVHIISMILSMSILMISIAFLLTNSVDAEAGWILVILSLLSSTFTLGLYVSVCNDDD